MAQVTRVVNKQGKVDLRRLRGKEIDPLVLQLAWKEVYDYKAPDTNIPNFGEGKSLTLSDKKGNRETWDIGEYLSKVREVERLRNRIDKVKDKYGIVGRYEYKEVGEYVIKKSKGKVTGLENVIKTMKKVLSDRDEHGISRIIEAGQNVNELRLLKFESYEDQQKMVELSGFMDSEAEKNAKKRFNKENQNKYNTQQERDARYNEIYNQEYGKVRRRLFDENGNFTYKFKSQKEMVKFLKEMSEMVTDLKYGEYEEEFAGLFSKIAEKEDVGDMSAKDFWNQRTDEEKRTIMRQHYAEDVQNMLIVLNEDDDTEGYEDMLEIWKALKKV